MCYKRRMIASHWQQESKSNNKHWFQSNLRTVYYKMSELDDTFKPPHLWLLCHHTFVECEQTFKKQDLFFSSCLTWLVPAGQRLPWHEFPLSWTTCNYQVSVPQTIPYRFNCDPLMTCNDDGSARVSRAPYNVFKWLLYWYTLMHCLYSKIQTQIASSLYS